MTITRRQTLVGAAATIAAAALPAVAITREQMTAVVDFGRWRNGRAVTAGELDEAGLIADHELVDFPEIASWR